MLNAPSTLQCAGVLVWKNWTESADGTEKTQRKQTTIEHRGSMCKSTNKRMTLQSRDMAARTCCTDATWQQGRAHGPSHGAPRPPTCPRNAKARAKDRIFKKHRRHERWDDRSQRIPCGGFRRVGHGWDLMHGAHLTSHAAVLSLW